MDDLAKLRARVDKAMRQHVGDPLLAKLTSYRKRLSTIADNVVTEKLSTEVKEVVVDSAKIDDIMQQSVLMD
jgi:hypothetical protein